MGQDSSTSVNSQPSQHSVTQHKKKENWVAAEVYYSEYDNAMWADDEEINERNDKYSRQLKTAQTKYGKKNIGHFTLRFKWCYFLSNMEKLRDLLEFTAIKYFVEKQKLSKEFSRSNRSILNWVADNITYNIKHSGNALNAAQAFYLRQGVCLEFSNIALSLLLNYGKNVDTAYVCVGYKYNKIKQKWIPNTKLKYIRCLTRDQYNSTHCYWRLHCLKLNNNGKLLHLAWIGESKMDENSNKCIQYLGVVHNWRNISGGHLNKSDLLPQYYEYPNGKHTIWRRIEGISFVSAHMALCYNEFCATLPQLNNLGQSSNEINCKLINSNSKIFWNSKFINRIQKKK
eukprot:247351_1